VLEFGFGIHTIDKTSSDTCNWNNVGVFYGGVAYIERPIYYIAKDKE